MYSKNVNVQYLCKYIIDQEIVAVAVAVVVGGNADVGTYFLDAPSSNVSAPFFSGREPLGGSVPQWAVSVVSRRTGRACHGEGAATARAQTWRQNIGIYFKMRDFAFFLLRTTSRVQDGEVKARERVVTADFGVRRREHGDSKALGGAGLTSRCHAGFERGPSQQHRSSGSFDLFSFCGDTFIFV